VSTEAGGPDDPRFATHAAPLVEDVRRLLATWAAVDPGVREAWPDVVWDAVIALRTALAELDGR
jgi:hypothetical protein